MNKAIDDLLKYNQRVVSFTQPTLSANGTLGGGSFAVYAIAYTGYDAYKAFDNNPSTYYSSYTIGLTPFIIYNPLPLKITSLDITNYPVVNSGALSAGNVYGSNNGSTYTLITGFTNSNQTASGVWTLQINSSIYYKYHKIEPTSSDSTGAWSLPTMSVNNAVYITI